MLINNFQKSYYSLINQKGVALYINIKTRMILD